MVAIFPSQKYFEMSLRTIHVANGCDCPIWVACIPDQRTSTELIAQLSENLRIRVEQSVSVGNAAQLSGLTKIEPGEYLPFITNKSRFIRALVYITILYEEYDVLKPVCSRFPREADGSVIVNDKYSVKCTKMGTIWTDTEGVNHRRSN